MQLRIKKILEGIVENDRVAGAYMFSGPPGVGKREAVERFAELLGCKKQDHFVVSPDGATFKIDQVRELQNWVRFGPTAGKYLLAVIEGADTLTGEAAAAFLKTLEEPAPGVVFVLLVEREDRLPPTILSRCQKIIFSENAAGWQRREEFKSLYDKVGSLQKNMLEAMRFSAELEKEKERREEMLYDLACYARHELFNVRYARIILDSLRFLKRKANVRLALDVMCLKLAEA